MEHGQEGWLKDYFRGIGRGNKLRIKKSPESQNIEFKSSLPDLSAACLSRLDGRQVLAQAGHAQAGRQAGWRVYDS